MLFIDSWECRQLKFLKGSMGWVLPCALLSIVALCYFLQPLEPDKLLIWSGVAGLLIVAPFFVMVPILNDPENADQAQADYVRTLLAILMLSIPLTFAYITIGVFPRATIAQMSFISFFMCTFAVGGILLGMYFHKILQVYLWALLGPFCIVCLSRFHEFGVFLALGTFALLLLLSQIARIVFRHLRDEYRLGQENKNLLQELQEKSQSLMVATKMVALGEMAGGVAHEINNPVAIIEGNMQKIRHLAAGNRLEIEDVVESATRVSKNLERITRVTSGLKDFSQDSSEDPFIRTPLVQLVEGALSLCSSRMQNRGVKIRVDEIDENWQVVCQPNQIVHALFNLLNNACDAARDNSEKWIQISPFRDDVKVELHVIDSGPGISPQLKDKILQPFFTTKEVGKGTGLGLSISHGIMRTHKGELYLNDRCAHTDFVLRFRRPPRSFPI